jgi:hypothetical protein
MKSKSIAMTAVLFLLTTILTSAATAQTKQPNLSGTWKMNAAKSKFERGGPSGITIKFDHKEPSISEVLSLTNDSGDRTVEAKYTTDGKETTQAVMGTSAQTSAKWEGEALTIEWKAEGRNFSRTISLGADGKTMTIIVKQTGPDGQGLTDTVVLEKQ